MVPCGYSGKKQTLQKKCPLCKELSNSLSYMAIQPVVKEELQKLILKDNYYICRNEDCEVVFFNEDQDIIVLTRDINMSANFHEVSKQDTHSCQKGCKGCVHS